MQPNGTYGMGYTRREDSRVPMASGEVFRATTSPCLRMWPARCVPSVVTLVCCLFKLDLCTAAGPDINARPMVVI